MPSDTVPNEEPAGAPGPVPSEPANGSSDEIAGDTSLSRQARDIIKRHSGYGVASGIIPIPFLDLAAASTVQLRMVAQLAELYGIPFHEQVVKGTISSLVASALPLTGVGYGTASLMRAVPILGPVLGLATFPALFGAVTYALGRTFAWHFSNGGTIEGVSADKLRDAFNREFRSAKQSDESVEATA